MSDPRPDHSGAAVVRLVQWVCGIIAAGTLAVIVALAIVMDPLILKWTLTTGQFTGLFLIAAVFGVAWLSLWLARGRPGNWKVTVCVGSVAAVAVVSASVWAADGMRGTSVQQVDLVPGMATDPASAPSEPTAPPTGPPVGPPAGAGPGELPER